MNDRAGGPGDLRKAAPARSVAPALAVVAKTPAVEQAQEESTPQALVELGPTAGTVSPDVPQTAAEPEKVAQTIEQTTQLTLEPSENGNYYVKGSINGQEVVFLLDTGASWISIPERLRWRLALERGRYVRVATAAGVVGNYATRVETLDIGPFHFLDVAAALNPYAPNDVVLLGMSALKDIQFAQSRGQLVLSQQTPAEVRAQPAPQQSDTPPLVMRRSVRDCMGPGGVLDAASLKCIEGR
ncbi:MAG: TIGR02281 family clan AA aspartic protease [Gammaproteobacteria bacterium]|nr:TIGR02281 family clan AA aspartic protease [Gammaproteobacteria bacterium]